MNNFTRIIGFVLLFIVANQLVARTYYVSPTGSSGNSGDSFNSAMDLKTALNKVVAGDVILCANGTYTIPYVADQKNTLLFSKSGTASKPISLMAENGNKATIDFSFPIGKWVQDSFGFEITGSYWFFKNINITRAGYQGVYVKGGYNTFENCVFYENRNTGLEINKGGNHTTVLNCDSYRNYDPKKGGSMADGFGPKQTQGAGNKFIGCRSWANSDDGYDCFDSPEIVTFENCWAFSNGIDIWNYGGFTGNGNGFKVGGNAALANNRLTNCVAFGNPKKGFDQNNNTGGLTLLNCTSYDNGDNYGLGGTLASGQKHTLKNNISLSGTQTPGNATQSNNSWNTGFSVSSSDFISLKTSVATIARNADGSIPYTDLFRLKPTSKLVDAGTNVNLPYEGKAPDLGAFEVEVNTNKDCNGVANGTAYLDNCSECVGGNTGKLACTKDCAGEWGGSTILDDCGVCGGSNACMDCNGDIGGTATLDNCGVCVGGNSQNKVCIESLEAEMACMVDGVADEDINSGFSGLGYVNTDNTQGASVSWVLNSVTNQVVTLSFRYANGGTSSRDGVITINGQTTYSLLLPSTTSWAVWKVATVNVTLNQGANEILISATTTEGLANIDLLSFSEGVSDAECLITTIEKTEESELVIFPNPTQNSVYWNSEQPWVLMDVLGHEIKSGNGESLNLDNYAKGLYLLKVSETIQRIIKE